VLVISDAIKEGVDPRPFSDVQYDYMQMSAIFDSIKAGYDISLIVNPQINAMVIRELARAKRDGLSPQQIQRLNDTKYQWQQVAELRRGMVQGVDIAEFANPRNSAKQMKEIRESLAGAV
jgi:hypothetical protein